MHYGKLFLLLGSTFVFSAFLEDKETQCKLRQISATVMHVNCLDRDGLYEAKIFADTVLQEISFPIGSKSLAKNITFDTLSKEINHSVLLTVLGMNGKTRELQKVSQVGSLNTIVPKEKQSIQILPIISFLLSNTSSPISNEVATITFGDDKEVTDSEVVVNGADTTIDVTYTNIQENAVFSITGHEDFSIDDKGVISYIGDLHGPATEVVLLTIGVENPGETKVNEDVSISIQNDF